jgi:alkanesulfonate monooxygenase SsuD/methylene tetrahydromethanopterin reductase-like flavin-dependent oxidoreductase (luciferase family)
VYVAESEAKAIDESEDSMMYVLGLYGKWSKWRKISDDKGRSPDDPAFSSFESHKEKCVVGSTRSVIDQVEMYSKRIGVNHMLCWMALPGIPHERVESSMRLFAKEVMPSFR